MWSINLKNNSSRTVWLRIAVLSILIATFLSGCGRKKEHRIINVSEVSGGASIVEENKEYGAYRGMHLLEGHTIVTSGGSYVRMVLDDDKYIKLEEGSRAKVNTLANGRTEIYLERGAITNEIVKPLYEGQSYIIHTPNATLAVRGTYFYVDLSTAEDGDLVTKVYTYGGSVVSQRKLPNGEMVEEAVVIDAGYKATINMDDKETVYVEEVIEEQLEYVIPISLEEISNEDLVDLYFAAQNGHEMFVPTQTLQSMVESRDIDTNTYISAYQQAESLGLSGKGTAPDDSFSRAEEMELAKGTTQHHVPSDGAESDSNNPLRDIIEEIISVFVPQDEKEVTEETESVIGIEKNFETDVATNTERISENESAQKIDRTTENEFISDAEQTLENEIPNDIFNLPNIEISHDQKEEKVPEKEITEKPVVNKPTESTGGSTGGGNSSGGSSSGNIGGLGGGSGSGSGSGNTSGGSTCQHTNTQEEITSAATCISPGIKTIKCAECMEEIGTEDIPELGHDMVEISSVAATCQHGTKVTKQCSNCLIKETTTGDDVKPHNPGEPLKAFTLCSYDTCMQWMINYNSTEFDPGLASILSTYERYNPEGYLMGIKAGEELDDEGLIKFTIDSNYNITNLAGLEHLLTKELSVIACSLESIDPGADNNYLEKLTINGCNSFTTLKASPFLSEISLINTQALTSIDISACYRLQTINFSDCKDDFWANFNATGLSGLKVINSGSLCMNMDMSTISNKSAIKEMTFNDSSSLLSLKVSGLTGLEMLNIDGLSNLSSVNASGCTGLNTLNLEDDSNVKELNLSNTSLSSISNLSQLASLETLDISECKSLRTLTLPATRFLKTVNAKNATGLEILNANSVSSMTTLNLQGCTALERLYLTSNYDLTSLDVTTCTALEELYFKNNDQVTSLDLSNCTNLKELTLEECTGVTELNLANTKLTSLDVSTCSSLETITITGSSITAANITTPVGFDRDNNIIN